MKHCFCIVGILLFGIVLTLSCGGPDGLPAAKTAPEEKPVMKKEQPAPASVTEKTMKSGKSETPVFDWQKTYAKVLPSGDLEWAPEKFEYTPGRSIRYIDFENGNDSNKGTSRDKPWKHHPWDGNASGTAAACTGIHTYVFKQGTIYRGALEVKESGNEGDPIILTRDPSWGTGEALIAGSETVTGFEKGKAHPDMPKPDLVWSVSLDFLPRKLWIVKNDGETLRLPLARTPNWKVEGRDDIKAGWWTWKNRGIHHFENSKKVGNKKLNFANDPDNLTPELLNKVKGGLIWSEFGWVMGTPYPSRIFEVYPSEHGIAFGGKWADNDGYHIVTNCRYYLEDRPVMLDDPEGEFWFEKKTDTGGVLYVIFPEGISPDDVRVEAARRENILTAKEMKHIRISGLSFSFVNAGWNRDKAGTGSAIAQNSNTDDVEISNCRFAEVGQPIRFSASGRTDRVENIAVTDCDFYRTDEGGLSFRSGGGWGQPEGPFGTVHNISVLRNRFRYIGMRPSRYGQGHCLALETARSAHVAGNILDMCWGAGVFVFGGKNGFSNEDVPFTRIIIHHNKVTNALLNNNDWGGIETWQGGPQYVFDNISGDIRGFWNYNYANSKSETSHNSSFGHAYYLDGGFKNYHFNNIAYGRTRDWMSPFYTCSAFQEIHSYQNTFFNNTAYSFNIASRRQAPRAGRDKFLSNIFDGMQQVFRHADGRKKEANAADAGDQGDSFAYDTNAYGDNLFFDVETFGLFEEDGSHRDTLAEYSEALAEKKSLKTDVGVMLEKTALPRGDNHDWRPTAAVKGKGSKVFVPWSLYRCVAEWNFYPSQRDGRIIDEHWDMPEYFCGRATYHDQPMFPLIPQNGLTAAQAVDGVLESWVKGAVQLDGKTQYYSAANASMNKPVTYHMNHRGGPKRGTKEDRTVEGKGLKNPQIYDSNLLVEVYFKTDKGSEGILVEKMDDTAGYGLRIKDGKAVFSLKSGGKEVSLKTESNVADGQWHHLVVEADRNTETLTAYIDGRTDSTGKGLGPVSLKNGSDLYAGGSPAGDNLAAVIDFMRICQGTLKDAKTSIEELYAWQFNGPFLRDFTGKPRKGEISAGAVEFIE